MSPDIVLIFDGGFLRPLRRVDIHAGYIIGLNDPVVNRYLDRVKLILQSEQSVIDFVTGDELSNNSVLWGIWKANSKTHIGTVRLHSIEYHHKTAHIGVCIFDKTAWRQQLGKKGISAVTQWAIDELGLRWVEAGAYNDNISSNKLFLSAGYEKMYEVKGKYLLDGVAADVTVYAARHE